MTDVQKKTRPSPEWLRETLRQGFLALNEGRHREASEFCRDLLQAKPDLVEGHFLVGLLALEMRDRRTAYSAFGSVTKLKPDHAAAFAQMAKLFITEGQVNRADKALAQAVRFEAGDPVVQDLVGTVYQLLGEHAESRRWYEKALAGQPEHVPYRVNRANSLIYHGETQLAEQELVQALKMQPGNPQAHWILSGVRKAVNRDHVHELEALLREPDQHPRALAFLNYALGKELEDLEYWDSAFAAFARGAAERRKTVEFDEAAEISMFEALHELFTPQWLVDQGGPGCDDPAPIFVLGQPRTGTTLIERIITSHSQVHSAGELQQLGLAIRRLGNYQEPKRFSAQLVQQAAELDSRKLGEFYILTTRKLRGSRPRFVDKLPPNYLYVPLILAALPNAKIVHLQRDPMDACFASFKQLFADAYLHSYDQQEMARHHARYHRLMAAWRSRFPGRFFDISYEDTVSNLERNARALLEYLQLPWEDACLEFHKQDRAVTTASAVQVREPAHTRSVGRWKRYEKQLQPMRATLLEEGVSGA
jgi:tetratricopeptide (TPR) repeat protein